MTADIVVCDVRFEAKEALDEQNTPRLLLKCEEY